MKKQSVLTVVVLLYSLVVAGVQQPVARAENSNSASGCVLPEGYKSDDIVVLYNDLKKKYSEKDEFETKEAYQKRMQAVYPQTRFSFVKDNKMTRVWGNYSLEYDAEDQVMTIKKKWFGSKDEIKIQRINYRRQKYEATNAFGARVMVSEYLGDDYCIYVLNSSDSKKKIKMQITPDQARDLKENLGILFVCDLRKDKRQSYLRKEYEIYSEATYSSPVSYRFLEHFINVEVVEMVLFSTKTGVIYKRERSGSDEVKG